MQTSGTCVGLIVVNQLGNVARAGLYPHKGKPLFITCVRRCKQPLLIPLQVHEEGGHGDTHTRRHSCRFTCVVEPRQSSLTVPRPSTNNPARVSGCVSVFVREEVWCGGVTRHTYWGVEGEGTLALENPVPRPGNPNGGHIRDQQLSEVCSHLRIPASRTTVLRSHRSSAVRGEDAIFKAARLYIPPARGM